MAGKMLEDAHEVCQKQHDSRPPHTHNSTAHVAATSTPVSSNNTSLSSTVYVNGLPYILDPTWNNTVPNSAHITEVTSFSDTNDYEYHTCVVISCNSSLHLPSSISSVSPLPFPTAFVTSSPSLNPLPPSSLPFILDTGATCHISPVLSDFKSISPITLHPIKGLGGMSVNALGMGTIILKTPTSCLSLNNAFS